jgi:hypothetical protein
MRKVLFLFLVLFVGSAYANNEQCNVWTNWGFWACPPNGSACDPGDGTMSGTLDTSQGTHNCVAPPPAPPPALVKDCNGQLIPVGDTCTPITPPVEHCGATGTGTMIDGNCVEPPPPPPPPPPPECKLNGVVVPNNSDGSCPSLPTPDCNGYQSTVNGVNVPNACSPDKNCYSNGAIIPHSPDGSCPSNSTPPPFDNCAVTPVNGVCPPNETIRNPDGSCAAGFVSTVDSTSSVSYCVKDPNYVPPTPTPTPTPDPTPTPAPTPTPTPTPSPTTTVVSSPTTDSKIDQTNTKLDSTNSAINGLGAKLDTINSTLTGGSQQGIGSPTARNYGSIDTVKGRFYTKSTAPHTSGRFYITNGTKTITNSTSAAVATIQQTPFATYVKTVFNYSFPAASCPVWQIPSVMAMPAQSIAPLCSDFMQFVWVLVRAIVTILASLAAIRIAFSSK